MGRLLPAWPAPSTTSRQSGRGHPFGLNVPRTAISHQAALIAGKGRASAMSEHGATSVFERRARFMLVSDLDWTMVRGKLAPRGWQPGTEARRGEAAPACQPPAPCPSEVPQSRADGCSRFVQPPRLLCIPNSRLSYQLTYYFPPPMCPLALHATTGRSQRRHPRQAAPLQPPVDLRVCARLAARLLHRPLPAALP